MKPGKIFLLANTSARTLDFGQLLAAEKLMNKHVPTEIVPTTSLQHAIDRTRTLSCNPDNLVVACGGDGTIYTVLNALHPGAAMGIIPAGTANVIARELGIPLTILKAAKAVITGAVQEIDTGCFNGQKFAFVAGIGFDAQVAGAVSSPLKRIIGRAAYHIAGLIEFLTYKAPRLQLIVDNNEECRGYFAIIANMRRYGGELFFAPAARYDDNLLDLLLLKTFSVHALLRLLNFARGNAEFPTDVAMMLRGRNFSVNTDVATPYQLDGEVFAPTCKFDISLSPEKTRIITP